VEAPVIVPSPAPSYTLAPEIGPLTAGQQATLDACRGALTGRVGGVVVTSAFTTATHHVVELVTPSGTLIALERAEPAAAADATSGRPGCDPD
jgi:O-acetyl-ADP-ribose deacetylase (regulator of RNase III)